MLRNSEKNLHVVFQGLELQKVMLQRKMICKQSKQLTDYTKKRKQTRKFSSPISFNLLSRYAATDLLSTGYIKIITYDDYRTRKRYYPTFNGYSPFRPVLVLSG